MPGPFSHLMICAAGMNQDDLLGEELSKFLSANYQFVFLGAESPDLPYLSVGVGGNHWADAMHYDLTNSQVISGFEALRQVWPVKTPADLVKCAWLLGYVSHMVADATVHPIVQAIVGPYKGHEEPHRLCEMTMDSLIFEEINHNDLTYAEFSQALKFCKESLYFAELLDFWRDQLASNYPGMAHDPEPHTWFTEYTDALDAAEGGRVAAVFRHLGVGGNYFYRNPEDIRANAPEDYQQYYTEVKFPGGGSGPFRPNGFDRAVTNVVNIWKTLYGGLSSPGLHVSQVVKNWNLDTGGDQDAGGIVTFWS
jgi:hypothetical protein